jgi:hypothetical protein
METILVVDGYTYHLISYAYVTVSNKDYIGQHKSPSLKFAGELRKVDHDHEWLTPLTPIERAPLGDTFLMEGGVDTYSRHFLEQLKEEEEESLYWRNVKPGWQQFAG